MKKISIVGPESSGKTTVARALAKLLKETFVKEYAREYLTKNKQYSIKDLKIISERQSKNINNANLKVKKYLITDTSIIDIRIWSEMKYNKCHNSIKTKAIEENFDLYLLCKPDLPWFEDPLRENPHDRKKLFNAFKLALKEKKAKYIILEGNLITRLLSALNSINKL